MYTSTRSPLWSTVVLVLGLIFVGLVLMTLLGCKTTCDPACCSSCAPQIVTVPAPPCVNVTPLPPPMPVPVEPAIKSLDPTLTIDAWLSTVVTDLEYWVKAFRECSLEIQANNGARPAPTPGGAP